MMLFKSLGFEEKSLAQQQGGGDPHLLFLKYFQVMTTWTRSTSAAALTDSPGE